MSKRVLLVVIGLGLATSPAMARLRAPEAHEPLPQATMIVPTATEAPEAPVQATADTDLDTASIPTVEDAEAAPLAAPVESADPAVIPASPADPLFIPGSRYAVLVQPAVALPAINAPGTAQPLPAGEAPALTQHRFKFRRRSAGK